MRAPEGLGPAGRSLWRRVGKWLADHEGAAVTLDPHEQTILGEACRVADRLAELRAVLADVDLASDAAGVRLLAEERQQRGALASLLVVRLGLPTGLADAPTTATSRRASKAALVRWGRAS